MPPPPYSPMPTVPSWDCVKFEDVVRAHHRIRSGVVRTPCERSHWLSLATGCEIFLKMEQLQFTGSFKERGARNALLSLAEPDRRLGVIAASAGNHALALAWHGKNLGIPVTVVMPTVAPMAKVEKCRSFGVNVVIHGAHIGEAKMFAQNDPEFASLRRAARARSAIGIRRRKRFRWRVNPIPAHPPRRRLACVQVHQRVRRP